MHPTGGIRPAKMDLCYGQAVSRFDGESKPMLTVRLASRLTVSKHPVPLSATHRVLRGRNPLAVNRKFSALYPYNDLSLVVPIKYMDINSGRI